MGEQPLAIRLSAPWRRLTVLDLPLGGIACGILGLTFPHTIFSHGDATALASGVIVASAALGALAITPIAIVLALTPGPRLQALMKSHLGRVRQSMSWAVVVNLLSLTMGIIDLVVDSASHPETVIRWLVVGAEFASLLAMARLVWFFVSLLSVDSTDRAPSSPMRS